MKNSNQAKNITIHQNYSSDELLQAKNISDVMSGA